MLQQMTETTTAAAPRFGSRRRREPPRLIGRSEWSRRLEGTIRQVAAFDSAVLISGETGCGKELVARAIHAAGRRATCPFVAVNCGALVSSLAESQLFGHEKGAFTGAVSAALGAVRAAHGGVLFLDEIGEMPLELQPLLLRVLQEREVTPVGAERTIRVDVQVIAATNRDIDEAVEHGMLREDLLYRLNTVHIDVPPLRDRPDDIPALIDHFSRLHAERFDQRPWEPDAATLERLQGYPWPGNVRELNQAIERVYVLGEVGPLGDEVETRTVPADVFWQTASGPAVGAVLPTRGAGADAQPAMPSLTGDPVLPVLNLVELRRIAVRQALARAGGHRGEAARLLHVSRNTMTKLIADACPQHRSSRGRRRMSRPR